MNTNFLSKSSRVYYFSLLLALLFYYPFSLLYVEIFKPIFVGSLLVPTVSEFFDDVLSGLYLSFPFFLSFLVIISKVENKRKTWILGIIFPFSIALLNGWEDILSYIIISGIGFILGFLMSIVLNQTNKFSNKQKNE